MSRSALSARFDCAVSVQPLPDQTEADQGVHAFAYTVTITNTGTTTAQLVARRWLITDAHGRVEEVRGLAVVGHQPVLKPGEQFEYTSWTRLATPVGTMSGTFYCMTEDAQPFEAEVREFTLAQERQLH